MILQNSVIEGIDVFANKFTAIFKIIQSQKYDPLDFRKKNFDLDYEKFKTDIGRTELEFENFFHLRVANLPNIYQTLDMVCR